MINAAQEDAPRPPGLRASGGQVDGGFPLGGRPAAASDDRDAGALDGPRRRVVAAAREACHRGMTCCSELNSDAHMLSCSYRVAPTYGGTSIQTMLLRGFLFGVLRRAILKCFLSRRRIRWIMFCALHL